MDSQYNTLTRIAIALLLILFSPIIIVILWSIILVASILFAIGKFEYKEKQDPAQTKDEWIEYDGKNMPTGWHIGFANTPGRYCFIYNDGEHIQIKPVMIPIQELTDRDLTHYMPLPNMPKNYLMNKEK